MVRELSRTDARRIAVRAQLLGAPRPRQLLDVVRQLGVVQIDLTSAVAPSADIVLWSRLGRTYRPTDLTAALRDRSLVELRGMIRPAEDLALHRAEMAEWPGAVDPPGWRVAQSNWLLSNDESCRKILAWIDAAGPVTIRELPDLDLVAWHSSGWNDNRSTTMLLEFMAVRGDVAVAGRRGQERLWDLAAHVYPDGPVVPTDEAIRVRDERRLHALGIARARGPECPVEPNDVGDAGEPAVVAGVRGAWRVDPAWLDQPFKGRVALLSPLDRLIYDRKRMVELFEFDYQLEMFKPAAKRRWGYYALPILAGDQLVGKVDATVDRRAGVLRVANVHHDVPLSATTSAKVDHEIHELARWLDVDLDIDR